MTAAGIYVCKFVQETTYGLLEPPLGSARLAVVQLFGSLLSTGSPVAEQAIVDSGASSLCQTTLYTLKHHQPALPSLTDCKNHSLLVLLHLLVAGSCTLLLATWSCN